MELPVIILTSFLLTSATTVSSRPNIIILLADDMGIGDVGCYGNTTLNTQNIDSLARDGIKLTQHLATESMCTPSRSAFLTGRYPKRYGMDSGVSRVLMHLASPTGLPTAEVTFAGLAKSAGYKTALIGKWHQGLYDFWRKPVYHPLSRGFDFFYGLPFTLVTEQGDEGYELVRNVAPNMTRNLIIMTVVSLLTLTFLFGKGIVGLCAFFGLFILWVLFVLYVYITFYRLDISGCVLMKNYDVIEMPVRLVGLTERFAREGIEFMKNQTASGNAFLMMMSWGHTHTFLAPSKKFSGRTRHGRYGDCVEELDWGIGLVLQALDDTGERNNTLVYFSSDHGGSLFAFGANGQVDGGYNGIYRGGKIIGGVDGGIRVPGLFRWPGVIQPNSTSDVVTTHLDIFVLISSITGIPLPRGRLIDGKDILPVLKGKMAESPYDFVYHYCNGEIHAVRFMPKNDQTIWKVMYRYPIEQLNGTFTFINAMVCGSYFHLDPPFLFDMTLDPGENNPIDIESDPKYREVIYTVAKAKDSHRNSISYVESCLTFAKTQWYPHLLSCCNFPFCSCMEEKYKTQDIK